MINLSDFRQKEIINIQDGKRFGYINDLLFDEESGKISAITIIKSGKKLGVFGKESEYLIEWDKIKKIGNDIILVDIELTE